MKMSWIALAGLVPLSLAFAPSDEPAKVPAVAKVTAGRAVGVGSRPTLGIATTIGGKTIDLGAPGKVRVILFSSTTCPIAMKLRPTLQPLQQAWMGKGVEFIEVYSNAAETNAEIKKFGLKGTAVRDPKRAIQSALGAKTSTEAFVLDEAGTLMYRGAVSDQFGLGTALPKPNRIYLNEALVALSKGEAPEIEATTAPGCALEEAVAPAPAKVTYSNQVSRIMQRSCVPCHRSGGIGPFKLDNFKDVASRKQMIDFVTQRKQMPPWFADDKPGPTSPWHNDRSLTSDELNTLKQWIADGAPQGNPKELPKPLTFPADWRIGTPTKVVQVGRPVDVIANGTMEYVNIEVDPQVDQDMWVTAYQIKPTDAAVVHHVLVFMEDKSWQKLTPRERTRKRFAEGDGEGLKGFFAGYVPGNDGIIYPKGFAKRLKKNSILRFQIHYTPNGKATTDQPKLGMVMSPTPPTHEVFTGAVSNLFLNIPPNTADYTSVGKLPVPFDARIIGFMPHMHIRGWAFKYELVPPQGDAVTLLNIPKYDFNWQLAYQYKEPYTVKAGSTIRATAVFNNSKSNPAVPDPERTVHWGDQTRDEMFLGYLEYYRP